MTVVVYLVLLLAGAYLLAVVEGWVSSGRVRLAAPVIRGIARLGQEYVLPRRPDRTLLESAPLLLLAASVLAVAVLPLAPGMILTDLATGALFLNAALAYVMVAVLMAGWGPDGAYAMVGGFRFLGQLIAYSMLIVMPITAVAMRAESLLTSRIVESQLSAWNAVTQPLGFALYLLAAMALAFLPPFDLPDSLGELAGGAFGEYTSARLAVVRLARLVLVLTLALSITVFYLGGWLGPFMPPAVWTLLKTLLVAVLMLLPGRFTARLRQDDVLAWGWKVGIPLALVNILWVGVTILAVRG